MPHTQHRHTTSDFHSNPHPHILTSSSTSMPPANAAAISRVLTDIANFTNPLLARPAQQEYLTKLTSTFKFTYYSATYGHTVHDAASLRQVLANTMRHHPNPEFGTAGGNAAVDTLFQHGCEMLEPEYVEEVMRAAVEEVVERREVEEEKSSEEEDGDLLDEIIAAGGDNELDEDFVPPGRRLRKREPSSNRKRKVSRSSSERDSISSEEGGWRDAPRKKILRKHAMQSAAVAANPTSRDAGGGPMVGTWRRSHVGDTDAASFSQHHGECGRERAKCSDDFHQKCRRLSGLAGRSPPRQSDKSVSTHEAQPGTGTSNNKVLREAVERLNRRVHTAIVQLWDEIGELA